MAKLPVGRIRFLCFLAVLLTLILTGRLFFVQIVRGEYYADKADRQYARPTGDVADRGSIFFSEQGGRLVTAAAMQNGYFLIANPTKIVDADASFLALAGIIPLEADDFYRKVTKQNDPYEELAWHLDSPTVKKIEALKLPGFSFGKQRWRAYPAGRLASHVIGFMAYDGDTLVGRYGLEKEYQAALERSVETSFTQFLANALSGFVPSTSNEEGAAIREADLVLTIEPVVQAELEKVVGAAQELFAADAAGGIIMDPRTGAILGMAAVPNFDPGARQGDITPLTNPLVERVFEMGSIVKPLTLAAGLDAGVITPATTYRDQGIIFVNDRRIANHDSLGRGTISMQEVINQSLNTGAVFVMQKLGGERFRQYFLGFGLGEKTGVDLPGEVVSLVKNLDTGREVEYATASFGQGIALTPVAMIRAIGALANGGQLVKPHVVAQFNEPELGRKTAVEPVLGAQIITPAAAATITDMLVKGVDTTAVAARVPGYSVAAKTGTAQMPQPTGGYYTDRFFHSYVGYFPAHDARFVTLLYLQNPQYARYSSQTLTVPFANLAKFLLHYYNVPPDRPA